MAKFLNQIVGLVRFSYLSLNGFSANAATVEQTSQALYDRSRLERRFQLFERLALPALLAQESAPEFQIVFLIGDSFPDWARLRLEKAIRPLKAATLVTLPPMKHYEATQRAFAAVLDPMATHLTSIRMDDDDALDNRFIARVESWAKTLNKMCGDNTHFVTGANRGYFLHRNGGENTVAEVVEKMPLGSGPAMTAPVDSGENIYRRNHRLLTQFYPTFTDTTVPAYIRSVHVDNDSSAHVSGFVKQVPRHEMEKSIAQHFPFDLAELEKL